MTRIAALTLASALLLAPFGCIFDEYCDHYDDWAEADRDRRALEARYGDRTADWPPGELQALRDAIDRRAVAANRMWAAAPAGADWDSVRRACA